MNNFFFVCLLLISDCSGLYIDLFKEVNTFLIDNGHKEVTIVSNSSANKWARFRPKDIPFMTRKIDDLSEKRFDGFAIFIFDSNQDNIAKYLGIMAERKVGQSLLIFTEPQEEEHSRTAVFKNLTIMKAKTFFYATWPREKEDNMSWYHVISTSSGNVMASLTFVNASLKIRKSFDLAGLQVTSTTLTWAPFLTINDCNHLGLECDANHGYLRDYFDLLGRWFNFTVVYHKDQDDDWGLLPKSGPFNLSGTWGGVMGDVINKKYDLSISSWVWTAERAELAQFIPIVKERFVLVWSPQRPETDFGLFTRPLTNDSWVAIFFMTSTVALGVAASHFLSPREETSGQKILLFTIWLFFTIVNGYYCGALTMFFTSTISLPFETERDVIQAHPEWNLMLMKGMDINIYKHVLRGDPDYVAFWARRQQSPGESLYQSEAEGLQLIRTGRNIISANEGKLFGHLRANPTRQKLHFFGHTKWTYGSLLVHLNSPLLPVLSHGVSCMRERGVEDLLHQRWIGAGTQNEGAFALEKDVLTPGQVVMVFALMMVIYGISLVFLGTELTVKHLGLQGGRFRMHHKA